MKFKFTGVFLLLILLVLALAGFQLDSDGLDVGDLNSSDDDFPDLIVINSTNLFPESVVYDDEGERFLVSSITQGTIFEVADDGTIQPFIQDSLLTTSSTGLYIDTERNRLLVNIINIAVLGGVPPPGTQAALAAYDLTTGQRLFYVDLTNVGTGFLHLVNDVTVDDAGNAYVTDSFSPLIYKVDLNGNASVFAEDPLFSGGFFGLSGIEFHPDGYLLVVESTSGSLLKVPLNNPTAVSQVQIGPLPNPDDLILQDDDELILVNNSLAGTYLLEGDDDWASATIEESVSATTPPTAGTLRDDDELYVLFPHLDQFQNGETVDEFEIMRIELDD